MSLSNPLPATWHVALCAKDALELTDSLFTTPTLQALIDKAQHILTHRHRVAHTNPNRRDSKCVLKDVYETLNEIINRLLQY